jgi:hypothetical protein
MNELTGNDMNELTGGNIDETTGYNMDEPTGDNMNVSIENEVLVEEVKEDENNIKLETLVNTKSNKLNDDIYRSMKVEKLKTLVIDKFPKYDVKNLKKQELIELLLE